MENAEMVHESTPERINAFSDGVFAIIITIMILKLKRPSNPTFGALFAEYFFKATSIYNSHYLKK